MLVPSAEVLLSVRLRADESPSADSVLETADGESTAWTNGELTVRDAVHPWDAAHESATNPQIAGLESTEPGIYVEPDLVQRFPYEHPQPTSLESASTQAESCTRRPVDAFWPSPSNRFAWHLDDDFTQLRAARDEVGDPGDAARIVIGHLDTGFDPAHVTRPRFLDLTRAIDFTTSPPGRNAVDPGSSFPMTNPGHGTATLALLAGGSLDEASLPGFHDILGGAPFASVVPIRIADSVVHFRTSSMARGIEYAARIGCRVLSISMGGVPARRWAEAVNDAYERGCAIFAAAGNRLGFSPPASIVFPARFRRVTAVCGFTFDKTPYFKNSFHTRMQGCFGPPSAMLTAMGAYTPNVPWAEIGCRTLVCPDGSGTSSATPQCAAAAALWIQKHLPVSTGDWRSVEAVRNALFTSADKTLPHSAEIGQGLLRAKQALAISFESSQRLQEAPDDVRFPWLNSAVGLETPAEDAREQMFEVEALQLFLTTPSLQKIAEDADPEDRASLTEADRRRLLGRMAELPQASRALKERLRGL